MGKGSGRQQRSQTTVMTKGTQPTPSYVVSSFGLATDYLYYVCPYCGGPFVLRPQSESYPCDCGMERKGVKKPQWFANPDGQIIDGHKTGDVFCHLDGSGGRISYTPYKNPK